MTNSMTVIKGRLGKIYTAIKGGEGHGGAKRFFFKHRSNPSLIENLYVSFRYSNVSKNQILELCVFDIWRIDINYREKEYSKC